MIKSLKLVNVQRHEKLSLNFCPYTNYITGETGAGKSAIARALRWVLFNKPVTSAHIMKFHTKKTEVVIDMNGHIIKRVRSKSKNQYYVDGQVLSAFNKDVPDLVKNITDMEEMLHFQKQASPYFLIGTLSGPECARAIEKFTDLSIISRSVQKARGDVLDRQKRVGALTESLKKAEEREKELSPVTALNDDVILCFERARKLGKLIRKKGLLKQFHNVISVNQEKENALSGLSVEEFLKLSVLRATVRDAEQGRDRLLTLCERMQSIRLQEAGEVPPCPDLSEDLEACSGHEERLSLLILKRAMLYSLENNLKEAEKAVKLAEKGLKSIPVCKTCGRPL